MLLVTSEGNLIGLAVDSVAGRFCLTGIQALSCHTAGSHFLDGVTVAVTDGLNHRRGRSALYISSRKVSGVVADDDSHARLLVAVICHGLCSLRHLMGDGEIVQSRELRVNLVIGLGLDVVQLPCKENRRIFNTVEVHLLSSCQGRCDVGCHQCGEVRLVVTSRRHFRIVLFAHFLYPPLYILISITAMPSSFALPKVAPISTLAGVPSPVCLSKWVNVPASAPVTTT